MAAITTLPPLTDVDTRISGELNDALVEALALPPDPRARSAVICALIQEMRSIVECLGDSETAGGGATKQELTSMRRLARAACNHRLRMAVVMPAAGIEPW